MTPLLEVKNLTKTYASGLQALKGVSFQVEKGEFLVVIGLSGSGKSTLLRCLNRMHDVTSGQILFKGEDIAQAKESDCLRIRQKIAMIFQHFNLVERYSVLGNVLMGRLGHMSSLSSILGLHSKEDLRKAREYLELVGISEKAYMRAGELSGGQQQRVAIARALMQGPEILLADEPVASLDPATCHIVMNELKKINERLGVSIICNLHFLSLVREYATRVIALKGGNLVFTGSPKEIDDAWFKRIYGESAKEVYIQ